MLLLLLNWSQRSNANNVVERYAYDAFGKRRGLAWDPDSSDSLLFATIQITDRGFTDHEHLDHVGLIHMNGRVYDPILGRFASADPVIQFPKSTQGFNRYSYVNNNPLSYTDPSGLFLDDLFDDLMDIVGAVLNIQLYIYKAQIENPRQSAAIGVMLLPGGQGVAGFMMAMGQGFAAGMILSGGNIEAGLMGAVTAGAFWGVGTAFQMDAVTNVVGTAGEMSHLVAKSVTHGLVGGASSDWAGGSFTDGFLGAASGQLAGGTLMKNVRDPAARVALSALIGGTAAEIGGGKFANGAITTAFGQAFNDCKHGGCGKIQGENRGVLTTGDKSFSVKYKSTCANSDCILYGAALDSNDPGLQGYIKARNKQLLDLASDVSIFVVAAGTTTPIVATANIVGTGISAYNYYSTGKYSSLASPVFGAVAARQAAAMKFSQSVINKISAGAAYISSKVVPE